MLSKIREDQPPFTPWLEMGRELAEISAQHPAIGIVDPEFHGRTRPRGNPRWIADDERRATHREQVRRYDLDAPRQSEPLHVFSRTHERARVEIGRDDARDAASRKHRREHAGTGADVERDDRLSVENRERRRTDEIDVLTADRRE